MTAQVGVVFGNHDEMANPRFDESLTAGADVALSGCVGLDQRDDFYARIAHSTNPRAMSSVATTIAMSTAPGRV
ncbi:hypothetical protein HQ535_14555 [bacterium]|nr:hypothetical protein [bacterium]